jgi:hypothetical protein
VFAEITAAGADYEQSNRTHLLTGAMPWQTERQPRIFGDNDRSASALGLST